MKKIFLLLLATMILFGCGNSQSEDIPAGKVITIGIDDGFPPMAFRDEKGELVGLDIDLAKETGKRMGVKFVFKPIDWDKKRDELTSGNIDMIWNGLNITEERKEYILFSKPYMEDRQIFFVKKGKAAGIRSERDLTGKIVATQAGATSETYVKTNDFIQRNAKEIKTFTRFTDALDALKNGEIDTLICDEIIARYEVLTSPGNFEIIDIPSDFYTGIGIGFRKDDTKLHDAVQKAFDEVIADGTAKKISEKWFDADLILHKQ
ncbi:MAG: amino acid ABC transporter substrate-binding protein [Selenomonadaceae bacterium]|nr:amino acid ABC transporter substrate-binding protein [Selenomonadaceae bacterium]